MLLQKKEGDIRAAHESAASAFAGCVPAAEAAQLRAALAEARIEGEAARAEADAERERADAEAQAAAEAQAQAQAQLGGRVEYFQRLASGG